MNIEVVLNFFPRSGGIRDTSEMLHWEWGSNFKMFQNAPECKAIGA